MEADIRLAEEVAVVKACKVVSKTAKNLIGHENPFWPALKPETIARKAHGNTPLLETGSMRDSIEWDAPHHDGNVTYGDVGSDNPKAVWHELGTKHIPPRSFLGQAAMGKEHEITEMMAKEVTKAMVLGGPNYRGMREVMHVLHAAYEKTKELGEEVLEEPESDQPHWAGAARKPPPRCVATRRGGGGASRSGASRC
jgi:hypothetical protein